MNYSALNQVFFKSCSEVSSETNTPCYAVGGWVRDLFLERECKDIDVVVVGSGIEFAKEVAKKLNPKIKVNYFANFGTAQFVYDGIDYEFVGARKESYQRDSRNPIIENGTIEDDIARRDFTINSLAISLNASNFGELLDLHGGSADLEKKILRTPQDPDITYSDDPLRMLRAVRFASQLNFKIEEKSFEAISRNSNRLEIISKERIHSELNKILLSPKPSIGLDLLYKTGLLDYVLPELKLLHGVELYKGKGHKDNFYHTLQVVDNLAEKSDNLWLRWAALLHDIAKPQTKSFSEENGWSFHGHEVLGSKMAVSIFKTLKLPLDQPLQYVRKLIFLHLRPIALTKEEITDSAVRRLLFEAGDDIDDLLLLCQSDITSKNEAKVARYLENLEKLKLKIKEVEERDHIKNFQPPITGEMIMKTYNLKPSRVIGDIKNHIKEAILDGVIRNDYDEAFALMLSVAPKYITDAQS
ncbi:MAG: CCA tRNA nucleotidyltransferase [Chitinophagales bacterium]|nr:CCA tRNA nucleotidyltransferase [Sphingobacteriales bacterium]